MADPSKKTAVVMLIAEHARIEDGFVFDPSAFDMPYGMEQAGNDVKFDMSDLPPKLAWMLWRFMGLSTNETK